MTRIPHRLSAVLMAAMLCPAPWVSWVYGAAKKQAGLGAVIRSSWSEDDRQRVQALCARLEERKITIQPRFYQLLGMAAPAQRGKLVSHCRIFFDSVDTHQIANTSCLTSMIHSKSHVSSFLSQSDNAVRRVAKTPALKSLASLFSSRGFPKAEEDIEAFMEWEFWWRGEGKGRTLDQELLRTISSMLNQTGLPDKKDVEDYLHWKIWWQEDGEERTLDRQLLRTFSSMFSGRGFPTKKAVDDYLQWEIWWQGEGGARTLDRQLLRTVSSMFSGRGLPTKKAVDDYLQLDIWWQGEGQGRTLDRPLLRNFSSMFHSRGLPDRKAIDNYLQWKLWWENNDKAVGILDRELLRVFSSMCSGKGLPRKKAVDDYLQLDVWWQGEGKARTLDRKLLRIFSSIFNRKGLPNKKIMEDYLQLDVWRQGNHKGGILDRELLLTFSSMFCGKGLPDKKDLDNYLNRGIWWQGEGEARTLDRELLRLFSSMFKGRGLPNKQVVDDFLQLDSWWLGEGEGRILDRELLGIFSSLCNGRGLPKKKAIDDYLELGIWWQRREGLASTLDRRLLHIVSLMFHGKGVPDQKSVAEYLKRNIWWQGEGGSRTLDRELLGIFSSMFHGKGLPSNKTVDDYLRLDIWRLKEGQKERLDRELLGAFALMFHGKGVPDKRCIYETLWWLTCDQPLDRQTIKLMACLYSGGCAGHQSAGLPHIETLRQEEQKLTTLIPLGPGAYGQGVDRGKENNILPLMKMVVLYLANDGGARQLRWTDCEAWLQGHPGALSTESLLSRLLLTLHYHGGQGVKEAVTLISGQPAATRLFVLDALVSGKALASVRYALQAIESTDWEEYLFFTGEISPVPSDQQWATIKGYLETLAPVLPDREYRRRFLTLIWPMAPDDRERFVQPKAVSVLTILLSSPQVTRDLLMFLTAKELKTVFDTCLRCWAGQPDKQGLPTLFTALLVAPQPSLLGSRLDSKAIVEELLAQTQDHPKGVVITGVGDSVTQFIQVMAAFMGRLWKSQYTINRETLTLWPHGETIPITFPTPSLVWHPDGVQIPRWTSAHLHQFYQATESERSRSRL